MKCPYCKMEINDRLISKYLGAKGGKKSKRRPADPDKRRKPVIPPKKIGD